MLWRVHRTAEILKRLGVYTSSDTLLQHIQATVQQSDKRGILQGLIRPFHTNHMWQSRVEVEDYSALQLLKKSRLKVGHFSRLTTNLTWVIRSFYWTPLWSSGLIQQSAMVKLLERSQKASQKRYVTL